MNAEPKIVRNSSLRDLSVLSYSQGFTLWLYKHDGQLCDVLEPRFFWSDMLSPRDMILVSARDNGALLFVREHEDMHAVVQRMTP